MTNADKGQKLYREGPNNLVLVCSVAAAGGKYSLKFVAGAGTEPRPATRACRRGTFRRMGTGIAESAARTVSLRGQQLTPRRRHSVSGPSGRVRFPAKIRRFGEGLNVFKRIAIFCEIFPKAGQSLGNALHHRVEIPPSYTPGCIVTEPTPGR